MFKNLRKLLDDYERALKKGYELIELTPDEEDAVMYFDINFSKAMLKDFDGWDICEKIAKIILATKGLSNDISVKIE